MTPGTARLQRDFPDWTIRERCLPGGKPVVTAYREHFDVDQIAVSDDPEVLREAIELIQKGDLP